MTGEVSFGKTGLKVQARGLRPDEGIDIDLKLPTELKAEDGEEGKIGGEGKMVKENDIIRKVSSETSEAAESEEAKENTGSDGPTSMISVRNRDLRLEMHMDPTAAKFDLRNLRLDELELASLRGTVDKAFFDLNFEDQTGRGNASVTGPRFSGLQGESLSGSFRWEGDIIRLERAIIQQKRSRYELQGEYVLPTMKDKSTLDMATALSQMRNSNLSSTISSPRGGGRWRWQVSVPHAVIEEMLPAAQLLSRATSSYPIDYSNAKGIFLEGVKTLQITAQEIGKQLEVSAKSALERQRSIGEKEEIEIPKATKNAEGQQKWSKGLPWIGSKAGARKASTRLGLQDLRGEWKGNMQAYGSTGGAMVAEFDVKGEDWQWGSYCLENVNAEGNYHPNEGLHFEKFQLDAGDARLRIAGNMLGAKQDAQFRLTDFPLTLLQSFFHVLPSSIADQNGMGSNLFKSSPGSGGGLSSMANLPQGDDFISGNLYVNAALGGSAEAPQGNVNFQVLDGALRNKRLARAEANAAVTSDQRFTFNVNLQPAGGPGHVKLMGSTPFEYSLSPKMDSKDRNNVVSESNDNIEVDVAVKDSGMLLLSALTPEVNWQMGSADIAMQVRGTVAKPNLSGVAHVNRASISCPWMIRPLSSLGVTVRVQDNTLYVDAFDGRVGRKGFLRINGYLPMDNSNKRPDGQETRKEGIFVDACGLELRVKNAFTGNFDGQFIVRGNLKQPELGGSSQFSKGVVYLVPQGSSQADEPREGMSTATVLKSLGVGSESNFIDQSLKGKMTAVQTSMVNKAICDGLNIKLGPELRAVYPFVLNFGIAGDIEINGVVDPEELSPSGIIRFDSGDVNLVATQLSLNPEYPNRAVFVAEHGLDPTLDISLVAPDLKAIIQGPASSWQDNLTLSVGSGTSETTERLEPSEIARIFEGQLTESLLEQDGRLAFSNLAASTISTLLPRIETQGQFGKARWRLVSAPSISGLLSLDPLTDPFKSLSNLTLGTEVEIQFGKSLQALIARKIKESEMATHWTLLYQLNKQLRMRLNSSTPGGTKLLFEFSGEGTKLQKEDWGNRFP
jgi:hypothetical protein